MAHSINSEPLLKEDLVERISNVTENSADTALDDPRIVHSPKEPLTQHEVPHDR